MTFLEHTPDKDTKIAMIKTLQSVTEGKVSSARSLTVCRQRQGRALYIIPPPPS